MGGRSADPASYTDIAIVGAGIIGCTIAREAASRMPEASIVVLDRDAVGCGASRRSAGLHFPRGTSDRVRSMAAYSQDYYEALRNSHPAVPIRPVRMSVVAAEANSASVGDVYLDRAGLAPKEGAGNLVRIPAHTAVWSGDGCQYADVGALTQTIARALRQRVVFREAVGVTALEPVASGVMLTLGTGECLTAGMVVVAPGPWLASPAWREYVGPLGARVKKIVALHIEQQPTADDEVTVFHDEDAFLLPLHDRGYWLFSYTCQDWDVDPDALLGGLTGHDFEEARGILRHWSPSLAACASSGRVFCDAYSDGGEPLVQTLDGDGRLVFAGAANGSGYRLAPAIAAEVADLLHPASDRGGHK